MNYSKQEVRLSETKTSYKPTEVFIPVNFISFYLSIKSLFSLKLSLRKH